jgi:uncharacterized membrane protein YebE (DUF533 family)
MPFDPSALLHGFDSDKLDALVDTMVLAADADGEIGDVERDNMIKTSRRSASASSWIGRRSTSPPMDAMGSSRV